MFFNINLSSKNIIKKYIGTNIATIKNFPKNIDTLIKNSAKLLFLLKIIIEYTKIIIDAISPSE